MMPRWLVFAALGLSVSLLSGCSKLPATQIASCRSAALVAHPPPRVIDYATYDRALWNEQRVEDDVLACMEKNGWQAAFWLQGCVSGSDMSRQSACYYRDDVVARVSRWITGTKPPPPPPHSFPVQANGQKPRNIVIAVDKDGNIYWNGQPIQERELRARFEQESRRAQAAWKDSVAQAAWEVSTGRGRPVAEMRADQKLCRDASPLIHELDPPQAEVDGDFKRFMRCMAQHGWRRATG